MKSKACTLSKYVGQIYQNVLDVDYVGVNNTTDPIKYLKYYSEWWHLRYVSSKGLDNQED